MTWHQRKRRAERLRTLRHMLMGAVVPVMAFAGFLTGFWMGG